MENAVKMKASTRNLKTGNGLVLMIRMDKSTGQKLVKIWKLTTQRWLLGMETTWYTDYQFFSRNGFMLAIRIILTVTANYDRLVRLLMG